MFLQKIFPTDKLTNFPFSVYLFTQKSPWREREREREPEREREREREREIDRARERAKARERAIEIERDYLGRIHMPFIALNIYFLVWSGSFSHCNRSSPRICQQRTCV